MNLQFKSLLSHIRSGAPYDDENLIVKNVISDIERADIQLKRKNIKDVLRLEEISKSFSSLPEKVDMKQYNRILKDLSNQLFDVFLRSLITNEYQAEWKEYFHSVYELCVIDAHQLDSLFLSVVLKDTYKYWDLIPQPCKLKQTDKLYPLVSNILELFYDLRYEHNELINTELDEDIVEHWKVNTEKAKTCCKLSKRIQENEDTLDIYREILQWSIK